MSDYETRRERAGSGGGGHTFEYANGLVTLDFIPADGHADVRAYYEDTDGDRADQVASAELTRSDLDGQNMRKFVNEVCNAADQRSPVQPDELKTEILADFEDIAEIAENNPEKFLSEDVVTLLEGVEYPVEIYKGEDATEWQVRVTFNGWTETMEFSAGDMLHDDATDAINRQIGSKFLKTDMEVSSDDWEHLRKRWNADENTTVAGIEQMTEAEQVAEGVLEHLATEINPTRERDEVANDQFTAWYDAENEGEPDLNPGDDVVVWVRSQAVRRALDRDIGSVKMSKLSRTLKENGAMHGPSKQADWRGGESRDAYFWPFSAGSLGITENDVDAIVDRRDAPEDGEVDV